MDKFIHSMQTGFTDFLGKYSVTLYFAGCNLRCPFCHNPEMLDPNGYLTIEDCYNAAMNISKPFLGKIGVVFSGGEPTNNPKLLNKAVDMFSEFPLGIHTNGLILPEHKENQFDSVVLSIKSPEVADMDRWEYTDKLYRAINYYGDAEQKQLRVVGGTVNHNLVSAITNIAGASWEVVPVINTLGGM